MEKTAKMILKTIGCLLCAILILINFDPRVAALRDLPNDVYVDSGGGYDQLQVIQDPFVLLDDGGYAVSGDLSERFHADSETHELRVELFGIPIKRIHLHVRESVYLMPGGQSIGVSIYTDGVLVVGLGNVDSADGRICPAEIAGIRAGDRIVDVNGERAKDTETLLTLCESFAGKGIVLGVERSGEYVRIPIKPVTDRLDGTLKLGMWVRESTAGIGTLSFYVMSNLRYGALGHAILDIDTGTMLEVREGEIMQSSIVGVALGAQGTPGELKGTFNLLSKKLGHIDENSTYGIFGSLEEPFNNPIYPEGLQLAYPEEIHEGDATLLTSVDADGIKEYSCKIIKLYPQTAADAKGMVIEITDAELLEKTGGIVQGMSGSPVIQNGKLAGVVTHVFINDPHRGYGIYSLWMYDAASK